MSTETGTIKYRLATGGVNYIEDFNLQVLKDIRAAANKTSAEWPIAQIEMTIFVVGDPQARTFESFEAAEAEVQNLRDSTFYVNWSQAATDPQPEGLND